MLKQIIKAELHYSRFIHVSIAPILAMITYTFLTKTEALNVFFAVILNIITLSFYTVWIKEKRYRFLALLPVKYKQIALARIVRTALPLILFYTILFAATYKNNMSFQWNESSYEILLLLAFSIAGFALYFIFADWMSDSDQISRYIAGTLAFLSAVLVLIALSAATVKLYEYDIFSGIVFILILLFISFAALFYTFITFIKRQSYL
ncbi:MAG: hypothetical protein H6627_07360 [Calditrichae bacterium]|nr:hypothetical protein [Calditrichota bacterium]MCB9058367.1 hypothetical protein [Calditrichia bacterium]